MSTIHLRADRCGQTHSESHVGDSRKAFGGYDWAASIARLTEVEVDGKPVKVTATAKLVAGALGRRKNTKTGQCNPLQETLADDIGASVRTAQKGLVVLQQIGALEQDHGRGNRGSFRLLTVSSDTPESAGLDEQTRRNGRASSDGNGGSRHDGIGGSLGRTTKENCELNGEEGVVVVCAREILGAWNRVTQQQHSTAGWLDMIGERLAEGLAQGWTLGQHETFIRDALADPWWTGVPSPAVLYKSAVLFEKALARALARQQMRLANEDDAENDAEEEWSAERCRWVPAAKAKCDHCEILKLTRDMTQDDKGKTICGACVTNAEEAAERAEEYEREHQRKCAEQRAEMDELHRRAEEAAAKPEKQSALRVQTVSEAIAEWGDLNDADEASAEPEVVPIEPKSALPDETPQEAEECGRRELAAQLAEPKRKHRHLRVA
jgi:hypothetical protein